MFKRVLTPFLTASLCASAASSQPQATMTIDPSITIGSQGQSIQFKLHVSTQENIASLQFTLEYDLGVASFGSVVLDPSMPQGFAITNVNEDLPSGPFSPGTNENVLVQITGDGINDSFTGEQDVAILTFVLAAAGCGNSPMNFERTCQRTHLSTIDLEPICDPNLVDGQIGIDVQCSTDSQLLPGSQRVRLHSNTPNPFNPSTSIRFELASPSRATLRIFDASGRAVRVLLDAHASAGMHEVSWDGRDQFGQALPSGVYYYQLSTPSTSVARRSLMLK